MNHEMEDAVQAIASMTSRGDKAQAKFAAGTSQHTLQENRRNALLIASSLIQGELSGAPRRAYAKEDLEKALPPIASLISKSEKARQKLTPGTWQYAMMERNLKALYISLPLIEEALRSL